MIVERLLSTKIKKPRRGLIIKTQRTKEFTQPLKIRANPFRSAQIRVPLKSFK